MKKLLLLVTIMFSSFIMSQEKGITTDEEYNYLTQGYKISLETGTDLKSGYELQKIEEDKFSEFTISYFLFKNIEQKKTKAMLIVLKKDKDKNDKIVYLCLPFNNGTLFKKFHKETESLGISMKMYFDYSIYNTLSKAIEKISNR